MKCQSRHLHALLFNCSYNRPSGKLMDVRCGLQGIKESHFAIWHGKLLQKLSRAFRSRADLGIGRSRTCTKLSGASWLSSFGDARTDLGSQGWSKESVPCSKLMRQQFWPPYVQSIMWPTRIDMACFYAPGCNWQRLIMDNNGLTSLIILFSYCTLWVVTKAGNS